jgi:beta-galactosidase
VVFKAGENHLRVVAKARNGETIADEIRFTYQTEKWTAPAGFRLVEKSRDASAVTVLATLHDEKGILCLDAKHVVRFSVAGNGQMIDNLGTSTGSRVVQLCNGSAEITIKRKAGESTVAIAAEGLPTGRLTLTV